MHRHAELELADGHVAEAIGRLARLRAQIAHRELDGRDVRQALSLLDTFEITLRIMIEHREQIAKTWQRQSSACDPSFDTRGLLFFLLDRGAF